MHITSAITNMAKEDFDLITIKWDLLSALVTVIRPSMSSDIPKFWSEREGLISRFVFSFLCFVGGGLLLLLHF